MALFTLNSLSGENSKHGEPYCLCSLYLNGGKAIGSKGYQMLLLKGNGAKNWHALEEIVRKEESESKRIVRDLRGG